MCDGARGLKRLKDMEKNKELTRAELDIMQIIWQKGKTTVHGILDAIAEPKPAYSTVSTIVRILEKKGFAGHDKIPASKKTHEYHPVIGREEYTEQFMNGVLGNFFGGSVVQMVSFFTQRDNVSMRDFDAIIGMLEEMKTGGVSETTGVLGHRESGDGSNVSQPETEGKPVKKTRLWARF